MEEPGTQLNGGSRLAIAVAIQASAWLVGFGGIEVMVTVAAGHAGRLRAGPGDLQGESFRRGAGCEVVKKPAGAGFVG